MDLWIEHLAIYDKGILAFVEISTYSFTELMNNVGGTFGLFLRATLMTFTQAILFWIERALERKHQMLSVSQ